MLLCVAEWGGEGGGEGKSGGGKKGSETVAQKLLKWFHNVDKSIFKNCTYC